MARPRSFDVDKALDTIRDVFWANGYQCTSFDQIKEVTGLNKPSLYAAFGDKADLFLRILDRYQATLLGHARKMLSCDPDVRKAVSLWLTSFVPVSSGARGMRGCLSVNTLIEGAAVDPRIREQVEQYHQRLEQLIRARLEQGIADKNFRADFNAAAAARILVAGYTGLMVLARQSPPADLTKAAMAQLLKTLEG